MSRDLRITITVTAAVLYLLFLAPWAGLNRAGLRVSTAHSGLVFDPPFRGSTITGHELAIVCVVVGWAAPTAVPSTVRFLRKITGF